MAASELRWRWGPTFGRETVRSSFERHRSGSSRRPIAGQCERTRKWNRFTARSECVLMLKCKVLKLFDHLVHKGKRDDWNISETSKIWSSHTILQCTCLACKYHKGLMDRVLCELSALKDLETFLKNSEDGNWELKVLGCVTVWICCCLQSFIYTLEEWNEKVVDRTSDMRSFGSFEDSLQPSPEFEP